MSGSTLTSVPNALFFIYVYEMDMKEYIVN